MTIIDGILDLQKYDFTDTSFDLLMQKRIHRVLIICSNYDNYMLEEDGRIDEQIFNEYVSLNLRYPPLFIQTDNTEDAFRILGGRQCRPGYFNALPQGNRRFCPCKKDQAKL